MAQQTLSQIIDAVSEINVGIPGIVRSYRSDDLPASLTQFPCAMVLLGPDDYTKFGYTEFWIRVFVAPVASAGNLGLVYQQCLALSEAFKTVYAFRRDLVGDRYIERTKLTTRMGLGSTGFAYTLKWGRAEFYGFQINLPLVPTVANFDASQD